MEKTMKLPKIDHEGNVYRSFRAMCNAHGISETKAKKKLYAGLDIKLILDPKTEVVIPESRIMELPKAALYKRTNRREYVKDKKTGEIFSNLSRCARANNISVHSLYHQMREVGLPVHEAINKCKELKKSPVKKTSAPIKIHDDATGKTYPSIRACAIANGVDPDLFRVRIKKGMSVQDAIKFTKHRTKPRYQNGRRVGLYSGTLLKDEKTGITYMSFSDCARQNGIDSRKLRDNIRRLAMPVHDAIAACQSL